MNEQPSETPEDIQKDFEAVFKIATGGISADDFKEEFIVKASAKRMITGSNETYWMEYLLEKAKKLGTTSHMGDALTSVYRRWQDANRPKLPRHPPMVTGSTPPHESHGHVSEGTIWCNSADGRMYIYADGQWLQLPTGEAMAIKAGVL